MKTSEIMFCRRIFDTITANEKVFAKNGLLETKSGKESLQEQNAFSDF
jgi:hypothetical protein